MVHYFLEDRRGRGARRCRLPGRSGDRVPRHSPRRPTHILIVPNREIPTVNDLADEDEALAGHMLLVARDLAKSEGIAESGYRLVINCNRDGNQEVFHLHLHLSSGDGHSAGW